MSEKISLDSSAKMNFKVAMLKMQKTTFLSGYF